MAQVKLSRAWQPDLDLLSERVLVVDDDPRVLVALRRVLESNGYEVDTAATPEVALALAATGVYAVLAVDLCLPKMHGLDLLPLLLRQQPDASYIIASGYLNGQATTLPGLRGNCHLVPKPWEPDVLCHAVEDGIEGFQARRRGEM